MMQKNNYLNPDNTNKGLERQFNVTRYQAEIQAWQNTYEMDLRRGWGDFLKVITM